MVASKELIIEVSSDHNASNMSIVIELVMVARVLQVVVKKVETNIVVANS